MPPPASSEQLGSTSFSHMRCISLGGPGMAMMYRCRRARGLDPPAGRGAARVGDGARGGDEHGCLTLRSGKATPRAEKKARRARSSVGVDEHLLAHDGGDGLAGEVVLGGAEAAGHDDDVGALEGDLDGAGEAVEVIADGGLVVEVDADGGQAGGEVRGVGVEDLAEEDLGAERR